MPTLNISGIGSVQVDDSFLKLSPDDQHKTVDEIASSVKGSGTAASTPAATPSPPLYLGDNGQALTPEQTQALYAKPSTEPTSIAGAVSQGAQQGMQSPQPSWLPQNPLSAAGNIAGGVVGGVAGGATQAGKEAGMDPGMAQRMGEDIQNLATEEGIRTTMQPSPASLAPKGYVTPQPELTEGQQVAAAGRDLGIDIPNAITTDNRAKQMVGKYLSDVPVAGTPLAKAAQNTSNAIANTFKNVAQQYGSGDPAIAGDKADLALTNYIKTISRDAENQLYNKTDTLVDPNVTRPLTATQPIAAAIDAKRANATIPSSSPATAAVQQALATPGGLNYQGIKDLRTYVGGQLDQGLLSGPDNGEMKQIYGGLTNDLRATVQKAGGDQAVSAFNDANAKAAQMADVRQNLVRLTKTNNQEGIVNKIIGYAGSTSTADIQQLQRVRDAIPPNVMDDIASTWVAKAGLDNQGNFSPTRLATSWGKLTEQGKNILFRSTDNKQLANILDSAGVLAKREARIAAMGNPSGSGKYATMGGLAAAAWTHPFVTLGGVIGGRVLAHVWSKPATALPALNWVKDYARAAQFRTAGSQKLLANSARILSLSIAKELNVPQMIPRITQEIQGIIPSQAQQQNQQ